jgi:hypothetical protein
MTVSQARRRAFAALLVTAACWPQSVSMAQNSQAEAPQAAPEPEQAPTSLLPGSIAPAPSTAAESPAPPAAQSAPAAPAADATIIAAPAPAPLPVDLGGGGSLPGKHGLGPAAWSRSSGGFSTQLMLKMSAATGSRYQHILLRRLLLTPAPPPTGADPVKFLNARAHLLLRMGEVEASKILLNSLPQTAYTRQSYAVAGQAHMAAIDLPSACPLATRAIVFSPDAQWPLISGVCSALQGDDGGAALGLDIARQEGKVNRFDLMLAEQMVTALSGGGRGGEIAWPEKGKFTSYRVGGVYSSGQRFPRAALLRAPVAVQNWLARSGAVDSDTRWALAWTATARGVMSAAEFSSLWAARGSAMDERARAYRPEGLYQRAFAAPSVAGRRQAFAQLLALGKSEAGRAAMWSLLAAPAAAYAPFDPATAKSAEQAAFASQAVRAMIMGGRVRDALKWWPIVAKSQSPEVRKIWALLLVASGNKALPVSQDFADAWADAQSGDDEARRIEMGFAALQGLGYPLKAPLGKNPGTADDTVLFEKLADAAKRGARGEVVLLSHMALGQSVSQTDAATLFAVLRAYRAVGLGAEARMIAADAMILSGA